MYIFYGLDPTTAERVEKAQFIPPDNWSGDYQGIKDILDTKHKWSILDREVFDFNNPKHIKMLPDIINGVYVWCEKSKRKIVITKGGPGSGHHGHAGRPGKVGGSASGKGGKDYQRFHDSIRDKRYTDLGPLGEQGQQATSKLLELDNGTRVIQKEYFGDVEELGDMAINDAAVYEISQLVGIDGVPMAMMESDNVSVQEFIDNSDTIANSLDVHLMGEDVPSTSGGQAEDMFYLDVLTGNSDRHSGNVLIHKKTSKLSFIDNSSSLTAGWGDMETEEEYDITVRTIKSDVVGSLFGKWNLGKVNVNKWSRVASIARSPEMMDIIVKHYGSEGYKAMEIYEGMIGRIDAFERLYASELKG